MAGTPRPDPAPRPDPERPSAERSDPRHTDGRLRKGEQRRRLLLDAAIQVIGRGGIAAVSQRVVAREAGLPPSAVTYYFPTVNTLLSATLADCNDRWVRRLEDLRTHPRERALRLFAQDLAEYARADPARLSAEYELWLLPARLPELRPEIERWTNALDELVSRFVTDPDLRAGGSATINGLILQTLWPGYELTADEVHRILRATFR